MEPEAQLGTYFVLHTYSSTVSTYSVRRIVPFWAVGRSETLPRAHGLSPGKCVGQWDGQESRDQTCNASIAYYAMPKQRPIFLGMNAAVLPYRSLDFQGSPTWTRLQHRQGNILQHSTVSWCSRKYTQRPRRQHHYPSTAQPPFFLSLHMLSCSPLSMLFVI